MCHSSGGPADLHKVIGCYKGNAEWPGVMCQVEGEKCAPTTGNPSQTVCTISFSCALLQLNKVKQPCSPLRMSQCTQRAPLELMSFKDVIPHTSYFFFLHRLTHSGGGDALMYRHRAPAWCSSWQTGKTTVGCLAVSAALRQQCFLDFPSPPQPSLNMAESTASCYQAAVNMNPKFTNWQHGEEEK